MRVLGRLVTACKERRASFAGRRNHHRKHCYRHVDFFDFMEATPVSGDPADADSKRIVVKHRIHSDESYAEQCGPAFRARPSVDGRSFLWFSQG